jgi:hypothetical protein
MQIACLDGFDYHSYPLVAMSGLVSKIIIFDVKAMNAVKSVRILLSNSVKFQGVSAMPGGLLACGCLDGRCKVYEVIDDEM